MRLRFPDTRYFKPTGECMFCQRTATGRLMSFRNEDLGPTCKRCGEAQARLAKNELDRRLIEKRREASDAE